MVYLFRIDFLEFQISCLCCLRLAEARHRYYFSGVGVGEFSPSTLYCDSALSGETRLPRFFFLQSKQKGSDQELIQSNPTSNLKNQLGKKHTHKLINVTNILLIFCFKLQNRSKQ